MQNILITGGAGFVGRWFTDAMLSRGHRVTVVDSLVNTGGGLPPSDWSLQSSHRDNPNFNFVLDDCRNYFDSAPSEEWHSVFHLAAVVGGRMVIERNPLAVAEDLEIDASFWRWALRTNPREIYHFSSSAAYPVALQSDTENLVELSEDQISFTSSIGMPDLTYGWAKLTSEYLGETFGRLSDSSFITIRPFSGYGEDQDLAYPFPSIVKRAIEFARGEIPEMFVWGSGLQSRDFIHISDVVRATLQSARKLPSGSALNIGSGSATSFFSLAKLCLKLLGVEGEVRSDPTKPEGVAARVADISKLKGLGEAPQVSLEDGIRRVVGFLGGTDLLVGQSS